MEPNATTPATMARVLDYIYQLGPYAQDPMEKVLNEELDDEEDD